MDPSHPPPPPRGRAAAVPPQVTSKLLVDQTRGDLHYSVVLENREVWDRRAAPRNSVQRERRGGDLRRLE